MNSPLVSSDSSTELDLVEEIVCSDSEALSALQALSKSSSEIPRDKDFPRFSITMLFSYESSWNKPQETNDVPNKEISHDSE